MAAPEAHPEERRDTMALKLNHVHLKTRDPQKTAQFYVDNAGATVLGESVNGGYRLDCTDSD
jgi:hypothetical protein